MADIKSRDELLAELKVFLRAYNKNIDSGDNSLVKDLILTPYSIGAENVMTQISIARDLHILSRLSSSDLDNEATNYKLERLPGTYATVTLTFFSFAEPTSDVTILSNTTVATAGSSFSAPIEFTTISNATYAQASMGSYYSYDRNRYEFQVTALCSTIGTVGNIAGGLISQMTSTVTGIDGVTNLLAATGGTSEESDDDLRIRIQSAMTGRDLNTVTGLRSYVRSLGFLDAYPIRVENIDAERYTGIDVFVIDNSSESATETFLYDPAALTYTFVKRPIREVTSVTGSTYGILASTDYDEIIDSTSSLRRSINAVDYLRIHADVPLLLNEQITVVYNFFSQTVQAQDTIDNNDNNILTADPLLKHAFPLYLYLNAKLILKANADGPGTRSKAKNALSQLLATYRLGDDIQKSDLIVTLQTGYGDYPITSVDYVTISSYYLQDEFGNTYLPTDEVITVGYKYFVLYGDAVLS
jgi:hypothetical protein